MKKFLMAIMAVLVLASCAGNVFEQKTKVYTDAMEKLAVAKSAADVDAIEATVDDAIKAIETGEAWSTYLALIENNDTAALKEYAAARSACYEARGEYALALVAAAISVESAE